MMLPLHALKALVMWGMTTYFPHDVSLVCSRCCGGFTGYAASLGCENVMPSFHSSCCLVSCVRKEELLHCFETLLKGGVLRLTAAVS